MAAKFKNLSRTIIISFISSVPIIGVAQLVRLFAQKNITQTILICIGGVLVYSVISILLRNDVVIDMLSTITDKIKKVFKRV